MASSKVQSIPIDSLPEAYQPLAEYIVDHSDLHHQHSLTGENVRDALDFMKPGHFSATKEDYSVALSQGFIPGYTSYSTYSSFARALYNRGLSGLAPVAAAEPLDSTDLFAHAQEAKFDLFADIEPPYRDQIKKAFEDVVDQFESAGQIDMDRFTRMMDYFRRHPEAVKIANESFVRRFFEDNYDGNDWVKEDYQAALSQAMFPGEDLNKDELADRLNHMDPSKMMALASLCGLWMMSEYWDDGFADALNDEVKKTK